MDGDNRQLPTSPDQITNMLMHTMVYKYIGDSAKFNFSLKTIGTLLLLLSVDDIRNLTKNILSNIIPGLKKTPHFFLNILSKIVHLNKMNNKLLLNNIKKEYDNVDHVIKISAEKNFVFSMYNFLTNSSNCKYEKFVSKATIANMKEYYFTEHLNNIEIDDIKILNKIVYEININTNKPRNCFVNLNIKNKCAEWIDQYDESQKNLLSDYSTTICKNFGTSLKNFAKKIKESSVNNNEYNEYNLALMVSKFYDNCDIDTITIYIGILVSFGIYNFHNSYIPSNILQQFIVQLNERGFTIIDNNNFHQVNIKNAKFCCVIGDHINRLVRANIVDMVDKFRKIFKNLINIYHSDYSYDYDEIESFELSIEIPLSTPKQNIPDYINKLIKNVRDYQKNKHDGTKINIYSLNLEIVSIKKDIENIEYKNWKTKMNMIKELKNDDKLKKILSLDIPPETIVEEISECTVSHKLLNNTRKDFDTLYLRKDDLQKLFTSIDQFKNKKEMLEELGLQNKLNILLYGKPGTGKSTTIVTIATFLERDIYYLDLKNVKTNNDLQMMIEYVNKNVQNGGIIVLEDIDAMTNVVLKRKDVTESRVNDLINSKNSELSLEYFLNILQGTLTLDDSIFIVTTNHIDHLDPAFYRDGRFDVKIELKLCNRYQINKIYYKFLNRNVPENLLQKIPEDKFSPATIIFHVKDYIYASDTPDEKILEKFIE